MFLSPRLVSVPEMVGAELTRLKVHVRVAVPPCPSVTTTLTVWGPRDSSRTLTVIVFLKFRVGANDFVVRPSIDSVAVKTSPESESLTVYSIVKSWFLSPRLRSLSEIRGSVFRTSRTGRKPTSTSR